MKEEENSAGRFPAKKQSELDELCEFLRSEEFDTGVKLHKESGLAISFGGLLPPCCFVGPKGLTIIPIGDEDEKTYGFHKLKNDREVARIILNNKIRRGSSVKILRDGFRKIADEIPKDKRRKNP